MSLGIVTALPWELATLTGAHLAPGTCRLLGSGVWVALTGVGARQTRLAGAALLDHGVTALLSWGTAAGLDPALASGSLLLPDRIIGADRTVWPVDAAWRQGLAGRLSPLVPRTVALAESGEILKDPGAKRRLFRDTGAGAADMESAPLAQLAQARGIPFCVIRAIVDPAGMVVPPCVLQAIDARGQVRLARLAARALGRPGDWRRLLQLAWHLRAARRALRQVITRAEGLEGLRPQACNPQAYEQLSRRGL